MERCWGIEERQESRSSLGWREELELEVLSLQDRSTLFSVIILVKLSMKSLQGRSIHTLMSPNSSRKIFLSAA